MSFAFMPLYTGDYIRDTRHLTPQKHGVYFLLLAHCWDQKGPLPLDEQECAGIANCRSADEVDSLRYILSKFFIRMDDGWYNRRMQTEIERAEAISRSRSDAGKKGYEAKAKQLLSICQASASTPTPTPTTTPTPKVKPIVGLTPNGAVLKEEAKAVIAFLNEKANRNYQPTDANLGFVLARLKEGYTVTQCRQVVAKKCREWLAKDDMAMYLRPATLFNREKFNQYAGELV
jgi:uncharacterized phage protein (TIGR02220 family)